MTLPPLPDLKPCPFCGGPVQLEEANPSRDGLYGERRWWGVTCRNTINLGGSCCMDQVPSASKEAAIGRWNMRNGSRAAIAAHVPEAGCGNIAAVPAQPVATSARGLLAAWQAAANVLFVSRSSGQYTTDTVSRDDLIQLIEAAFAAAPQAVPVPVPVPVPAWQPIETAPKDGKPLLIWCDTDDGGEPMTMYRDCEGRWLFDGEPTFCAPFYLKPTHWMPLPAAPKEQPHE